MRSSKVLHVVSCHAEGEVGDVIVGGVPPPPDMAQDLVPREHALVSQYLPDGLERPPRA